MAQTVIVPMTHLKAAKVIFDGLSGAGYTVLDKGTGFATSVDGIHPQNGERSPSRTPRAGRGRSC